jgi:hypothetical protein
VGGAASHGDAAEAADWERNDTAAMFEGELGDGAGDELLHAEETAHLHRR